MIPDYTLLKHLFEGGYLKHRASHNKRYGYAMYSEIGVLAYLVSNKQFSRHKDVFKVKSGKYTLNLNSVRQQHGNSDVKQLYKKFKSQKNGIGSNIPEAGVQV